MNNDSFPLLFARILFYGFAAAFLVTIYGYAVFGGGVAHNHHCPTHHNLIVIFGTEVCD